MNRTGTVLVGALVMLNTVSLASGQTQMGTAFTYQGYLELDGSVIGAPVPEACDFEFSLWDAGGSGDPPVGGSQKGPTVAVTATVDNGLFAVPVDFGEQYNGEACWLQMAVCCPSGACTLQALNPRAELTPVAHALALPGLYTQQNAISPNLIGGYSGNSVTAGAFGATVAGGGASANTNRVTDNYGTIGGGAGSTASGWGSTVPGGWLNQAGGVFSFAAGRRAKVRDTAASGDADGDEGTFVWADSTGGTSFLVQRQRALLGCLAPATTVLTGLNHTAHTPAVYASQCRSPEHHARLAPRRVANPSWTGLPPVGSQRKVSAHASSFPRLSLAQVKRTHAKVAL